MAFSLRVGTIHKQIMNMVWDGIGRVRGWGGKGDGEVEWSGVAGVDGVGWGEKAFVLPHACKSRVMALGVLTTRSPQEQTHPQGPPFMFRFFFL